MQKNQKIHNHIFPNLNKYENLSKKYKSVTLTTEISNFNFDGVSLFNYLNSTQKKPGFIFQKIPTGERECFL